MNKIEETLKQQMRIVLTS